MPDRRGEDNGSLLQHDKWGLSCSALRSTQTFGPRHDPPHLCVQTDAEALKMCRVDKKNCEAMRLW